MKLSVIIVNYNVCHFLEQCLHSLYGALQGIDSEVWVVDNASSDESLALLQPLFPGVKWVASKENLGFSRANNLALARAAGEYILFLNPDTLLPEDCLHLCLAFMQNRENAGALGIRMVDGSGNYLPESKRGYPGPLTSFFKLTGMSSVFPSSALFARYYLGHLNPLENHPAEVLAGAFMLIKRQVLAATGGFDERYFMYGEDIDLSFQINHTPMPGKNANWQTWYFSGSSIVHFKGESTQRASWRYVRIFYKAMVQFVNKHYPAWRARVFSLFIYAAMLFRGIAGLVFRKMEAAPSMGPIWIAGTIGDFEEVKSLLAYPDMDWEIAGRLGVGNEVQPGTKSLEEWFQSHPGKTGGTLIFCAGPDLPMKEIMRYLQPGRGIRYMFHYRGSKSIVGSTQSKHSGEVITRP